jgi:hypothetical protein
MGAEKLFYYKFEEAEEIRKQFISWIGKKAHIGKGFTETLKAITIKPKRELNPLRRSEKFYRIIFEFENKQKLSGHEFLFYNSLGMHYNNPYAHKPRQGSAA